MQYCLDALSENTNIEGEQVLHPHNYSEHCKQTVRGLHGDLPMLLDCHTLTMNTIVLQLSDAVADISMLQCFAQFRILIINAHFVVDNATHALASSATAKPTFNVEE